jgi:hypothetical protein
MTELEKNLKLENYKLLSKIVDLQRQLDEKDALLFAYMNKQVIHKW